MSLPSVPAGFQYTTLTLPGGGWSAQSIPYGQNPAIVTGDTLMTPLLTSGGHAVVATADGIVAVDTGGSTARELLVGVDVFDASADAFIGAATFAINNQSPNADPLDDPIVLRLNQAMAAQDLAALYSDAELDTLTFAITSGSAPAGTSVSGAGQWTGTPTGVSTGSFTLTATDPYGATGILIVAWAVIDQVAVPDVDNLGTLEGDALIAIAAAFLAGIVVEEPDPEVPLGEVISQSPSAGELVAPGSIVTIIVSTGRGDIGFGAGMLKVIKRRRRSKQRKWRKVIRQ